MLLGLHFLFFKLSLTGDLDFLVLHGLQVFLLVSKIFGVSVDELAFVVFD